MKKIKFIEKMEIENPPSFELYIEKRKKKKKNLFKKTMFILIGLVLLELLLRTGGFVLSIKKNNENLISNSTYVILTLGESTTANSGHSWPEQLQLKLNNLNSEKKIKIINVAKGGTSSVFLLSALTENIKRYNPNMIISMMGINDNVNLYFENNQKNKFKLIGKLRTVEIIKLIIQQLSIKKNTNKNLNIGLNISMIKISKNITFSNDTYWTKKYKKELKIGEKKGYAFKQLGLLEFQNKNIEASTFYFYNALTYNKNCISCWTNMGENFISTNELEKAEKIYTKLLLYIENNDILFTQEYYSHDEIVSGLLKVYEIQDKSNEKEILLKKNNLLIKKKITESEKLKHLNQKHHYQVLYNISKKNKIKLVAMQYPTKNIQDLKDYFSDEQKKEVIFISNKENFEHALNLYDYDEIFIDRCYNQFGHATAYGDDLIATNVFNNIISELNLKKTMKKKP